MSEENMNQKYLHLFPSENAQQLIALESKLCDLSFDVFLLSELTNGKPLLWMGLHVLQYHNLIDHFNLIDEHLINFLNEIESLYHKENPYHNNTHAADVTQTTHFLLTTAGLGGKFTKLEVLSVLISAIVHDVDHPGFNNNFLINTMHPFAITHNDNSVLENHHCSVAFFTILKPNNNFIQNLSKADQILLRKLIIYLILGTDFSKHQMYIEEFKNFISRGLPMEVDSDRLFFLLITLKCADLGHTTKPFRIHTKWSYRITEEMIAQAEEEIKRGYEPTLNKNMSIESSQISFITGLVQPLFTIVNQYFPDFSPCLAAVTENLVFWHKVTKHNQ